MNVDLSTNQRSAPSVPNQRTQRLAPRSGAKSKRFPSRLCSAVRAPGSMKGVFGDEENQLPLDSPDDPPDFDPAAKRRPWSADEDEHLKQLVGEHGQGSRAPPGDLGSVTCINQRSVEMFETD